MVDENEQLTMEELLFEMKNKYRDFGGELIILIVIFIEF